MNKLLLTIAALSCTTLAQAQSRTAINDLITCEGQCLLIDTKNNTFFVPEEKFKAQIGELSNVDFLTSRDALGGGKTEEKITAKCRVASSNQLSQFSTQGAHVLSFFREVKNITISRVYVCDIAQSAELKAWLSPCSKLSVISVCGPFGNVLAESGLQSIGWGTDYGFWFLALLK